MAASKWTARDLGDLTGRRVVVTGASSGIGATTARDLAGAGAHVVLAVRDIEKGHRVARNLGANVEVRHLELADLESVCRFAGEWSGDLDVLINNAGIMMVPQFKTIDDFELHIGTNHLGPFALTNLLLPFIKNRVVTVSSLLHRRGHIYLDDLNGERRPYNALHAYRNSKLANVLFTFELQRRLIESGSAVRAVCAHPGIARTNLMSHIGGTFGFVSRFSQRLFNDEEMGALPTLFAATQDIPGGSFVGPNGFAHLRGYPVVQRTSRRAQDAALARDLWTVSARLTQTGQ